MTWKKNFDLDRTRTCNPQIRSLMPYPLGHKAGLTKEGKTRTYELTNFKSISQLHVMLEVMLVITVPFIDLGRT